jgi:hypothetical protein
MRAQAPAHICALVLTAGNRSTLHPQIGVTVPSLDPSYFSSKEVQQVAVSFLAQSHTQQITLLGATGTDWVSTVTITSAIPAYLASPQVRRHLT